MMPAPLLAAVRTGVQAVVALLVGYAVSHGLDIPTSTQDWLVKVIVAGIGIGVWTAAVHWLETRKGSGMWPSAARRVAKLLMFGNSRPPIYPPTAQGLEPNDYEAPQAPR